MASKATKTAVRARLGFGMAMRLADDDVLWLCRPETLRWNDTED